MPAAPLPVDAAALDGRKPLFTSTIPVPGSTAMARGACGFSPACVHIRPSPAGPRRSSRNAVANGFPVTFSITWLSTW